MDRSGTTPRSSLVPARPLPATGCRSGSSGWTPCHATPTARCSSGSCASGSAERPLDEDELLHPGGCRPGQVLGAGEQDRARDLEPGQTITAEVDDLGCGGWGGGV